MEGQGERTNDGDGTVSTVAWLLGAFGFLVGVWVAVGWAVHSLVAVVTT